jgi:hypothetical protein
LWTREEEGGGERSGWYHRGARTSPATVRECSPAGSCCLILIVMGAVTAPVAGSAIALASVRPCPLSLGDGDVCRGAFRAGPTRPVRERPLDPRGAPPVDDAAPSEVSKRDRREFESVCAPRRRRAVS